MLNFLSQILHANCNRSNAFTRNVPKIARKRISIKFLTIQLPKNSLKWSLFTTPSHRCALQLGSDAPQGFYSLRVNRFVVRSFRILPCLSPIILLLDDGSRCWRAKKILLQLLQIGWIETRRPKCWRPYLTQSFEQRRSFSTAGRCNLNEIVEIPFCHRRFC